MRAALFDVFGTLLDVYSVQALAERLFPGNGARLAQTWRDKQIEYTRLRTLSARYAPFSQVTREALEFCVAALALDATEDKLRALLAQYERLAPFPESLDALESLRAAGVALGVLTNGDPPLVRAALDNARLLPLFKHVLSADSVQVFKTAAPVYALGPQALGTPASEILFVSSNGWDAIGATWFGYATFWVNRTGAPLERLGTAPHATGRTLTDAADFLISRLR
ncbi:haloacid dehalogenase type II [Betaproteobacteria bacterium PRO7]|jgi:2-haloacid dehalogenase|nr:haloacid dehalogenase type II [Betaproteobacteria bacterium PRO7]